ncbi:hypothetical protein AB4571_01140 [Vibrio breoganii]|uniref:hypothetical protein n=1 Tax=Vibrio breoganii TaxID=553239 RepID=UPI000C8252E3|nr:hypothetical protein [Vibrio breoganii]PML15838.1 hypothetical protein BCT84_07495 [Vibrio breoganii]
MYDSSLLPLLDMTFEDVNKKKVTLDELKFYKSFITDTNTEIGSLLHSLSALDKDHYSLEKKKRRNAGEADKLFAPDLSRVKSSKRTLIELATQPQETQGDEEFNIPEKNIGFIHLYCDSPILEKKIRELAEQNWEAKLRLKHRLPQYMPGVRDRATFTKEFIGNHLYQTFIRKIPLCPPDTLRLSFTWKRKQLVTNAIPPEEAINYITKHPGQSSETQIQKKIATVRDADAVFVTGTARIHPEFSVCFKTENGTVRRNGKAHSPLIVLSSNTERIKYNALRKLEIEEAEEIEREYAQKIKLERLVEGYHFYSKKKLQNRSA